VVGRRTLIALALLGACGTDAQPPDGGDLAVQQDMACSSANFVPGCVVDCCPDPRCVALSSPCPQGLVCQFFDHNLRCGTDGNWHCVGGGVLGSSGCPPAGIPCTQDSDCSDGHNPGQCFQSTFVDWPGGYCSATCSIADNDPSFGTNYDCPAAGPCATIGKLSGLCIGQCLQPPDCRKGYACVPVNAHALGCIPTSLLDGGAVDGGAVDGGAVDGGAAADGAGSD
jgi:hypothetical protein